MPAVSITLEDINRTILSNVYYKIVDDIISSIKIPYDALVILHNNNEITTTDNRSNATQLDKDNIPTTVSKRRVIVSITEDYNEDELTTTAVHQLAAYPIFVDNVANVSIYPMYIKTDINIEFSYISSSKMEANRIRDDIRIRLSQTRNILMHDVEYDILIPTVVEEFIADVYDLRSRLRPQSLEDYFREHSTKRIHLLTDMANKDNARLAIYEKQVRIVGLFDFNSMPDKIDVDNENNNYKISFNYKLSLDVPRAIVLRYPVMICNKPLPSKYLSFIEDHKRNSFREFKRDINYTGYSLAALSHFEAHRQLENRVDINIPINIPLFDDFNIRQKHKGYGIVASFLTDIDESDKKTLFNLREIEPYYISEELLEYIVNYELDFIINPYMSFIYLGLWQDDLHYDNNVLEVLPDLTIKSKVELELCKVTRVTLSICIDLNMINPQSITRLLNNPNILIIYLNEFVRAYSNYKTEAKRTLIQDSVLYRNILTIINYYVERDMGDVLVNVFKALANDEYIFTNILSIIYNNYPIMTRYLLSKNIVSIDKVNRRIYLNDIDTDSGYMKTVMTGYIVALRMSDIK